MTNNLLFIPFLPVSRPKPLASAVRALIAGGLVLGVGLDEVRAELPIPLNVSALASQGQAAAQVNGNTMTIKQSTDRATLQWQSFNIGAQNSVHFDQPSASSIALNNIHQADPSRIMGSLSANGQIYLVNQNGFVFGRNSQINVNSLVATTLGITDETFERGITKVFDINNAAALERNNGELYLRNDQGQFVLDQNGEKVKIQIFIEAGAQIKTNAPGGRVIIAAPVVTNAGTVETHDGQTLLVGAQDKVYLQEAGADSDVRGLVVEVGKGGKVDNIGKVIAERGNVSLIGFAVNQQGIASATTSVRLNGTVRLLAREGIRDPIATGGRLLGNTTKRNTDLGDGLGTSATVNLAENSLTSVNLDADKSATAIDAQPQLKSRIEISGHKVILRQDSTVQAQSGTVDIAALDNLADPTIRGDARIYMEKGSKIDVSGVKNVSKAMESNVVEVELRKNELRDAPLQRDGVLFAEKVKVDLRDANLVYDPDSGELISATIPVADIKGAVDRIARNIDERSTDGGTINLTSSGDVVTRPGSLLDFSGGSVAYRDGFIETTKLVSDGLIFDISKADPNRRYDSILGQFVKTYPKWGITERWSINGLSLKRFEKGYVEGKDAGQLRITAYESLLDGALNGQTIIGPLQRTPDQRALGSLFTLNLSNGNVFGRQNIVFNHLAAITSLDADDAFPRDNGESATLNLAADLFKNAGIHRVDITTNGSVRIVEGARIELPVDGSLHLAASGFDLQGSIIAPSGEVSLQPTVIDEINLPSSIVLGSNAMIDVSGQWVNDLLASSQGQTLGTVSVAGGTVTLVAEQGDLHLSSGSRIDVSAGAWLKNKARVEAGQGGAIELVAATTLSGGDAANLVVDGELSGWALYHGGRLSLSANEVVIGSAADAPVRPDSPYQPLILSPEFFQQGGFSDYSVTANLYGLKVADNVQLRPVQKNLQLNSKAFLQPTGSDLKSFAAKVTLPEQFRSPTHLTLSLAQLLAQNRQESLTIGQGAQIKTGLEGTVTLNSDTSIFIDGTIDTPAGHIVATIKTPAAGDSGFFASQGIWLGPDSRLSARGAFRPSLNAFGLTTGDVLNGGTVELIANRGYIVSYAGSTIDVSGTAQVLDFLQPGSRPIPRSIPAGAGNIVMKAGEGILADGSFTAVKGGDGAKGGSLAIEINRGFRDKPEFPVGGGLFPDDINANQNRPRSIVISAGSNRVISDTLRPGDAISTPGYNGLALLKSSQLNNSGFSALTLKTDVLGADGQYQGSIRFDGDVTLTTAGKIVLDTPSIQTDSAKVTLNTAYAVLGSTMSRLDTQINQGEFSTILAPNAIGGEGVFSVQAKGIDLVGGLSFNGFNQANLNSVGDIRAVGIRIRNDTKDFLGELKLAGDLSISAAQLYPSTLTHYTFSVENNGTNTITISNSGGTPGPVYSAGGNLTFAAPNIIQKGVVKAPFGTLTFNAQNTLELVPGSLTSVAGNGLTVLFGRGSGGMSWLYPITADGTVNLVIDEPPEKRLALTGRDVLLQDGANIDLSGGGDLYAYEFIPGPGGSRDFLDASQPDFVEKFAVLPGLGSALTPYDPLEFPASGLHVGDSVYLAGSAGLSAGWYKLLPARYALVPGAFLVTPRVGNQDMLPNQSFIDFAGVTVVAGRYGAPAAGIEDARWQGFAVEPGSVARTYSEFADYSANTFFADKARLDGTLAPQLPNDAGILAIAAQANLTLAANLSAAPVANGRGGQVDISADRLAVVGSREDLTSSAPGTVTLWAEDLNNLNAPSLLLGGLRSKDKKGQRITVTTQTMTVDNNSQLSGAEIILAAKDALTLKSGSAIESTGSSNANGIDLLIENRTLGNEPENSDGALLRVSSAGQINVIRDQTVTGNTGILTVEEGARLNAQGSMLLDASQNTVFDGDIDMQGGSLALKSRRISIGAVPDNTPGLVLSSTQFNLDELRLISATDFDIYGSVDVSTRRLILGAANINGFNNQGGNASISADHITLLGGGATADRIGTGTGLLSFNAREIELGSGSYAIQGFSQVDFNATGGILGAGQFTDSTGSAISDPGYLRVAGNLGLNAGILSGGHGATTTIDASGYRVDITSPGTVDTERPPIGLGVKWTLVANDIVSTGGHFDLPSGILELTSLTGDISLNSGTHIDVAGRGIQFADRYRYSPAGTVQLTSNFGNINLADGASINLKGAGLVGDTQGSSAHQASNAGSLKVSAAQGSFQWLGLIDAGSGGFVEPQLRQGSFSLDVETFGVGGFSLLNDKLAEAGFAEQLRLRQRNGDVMITGTDSVKAKRFDLTLDQGQVSIDGRIDVSGAEGGVVDIYGRNGIVLGANGAIDARAMTPGGEGGRVKLDTVHRDAAGSGLLDLSAQGGSINVSAGANGSGGSVHLRTGRDADGSVAVTAINSAVIGSEPFRTALEATRTFTPAAGIITASDINNWKADTSAFMSIAQKPVNLSGADIQLLPGLDISSVGDLTLQDKWDFMDGSWNTVTQSWVSNWRYADATGNKSLPGFLTLRSSGDLNIAASLTDAFATAPIPGGNQNQRFQDMLQPGLSWSYQLIAGGDVKLSSSYMGPNPLSSNPNNLVKTQVMVRTGTGDIRIDANGDISFLKDANDAKAAAAVYTMGSPAKFTRAQFLAGIPEAPARNPGETDIAYLNRLAPDSMNELMRYGYFNSPQLGLQFLLAEYPTEGGSIDLRAGGDIEGLMTGQKITDWLVKSGAFDINGRPTAWGININGVRSGAVNIGGGISVFPKSVHFFNQNVGALGGGHVSVDAGGDVRDLSVMMPTTGKPFGKFGANLTTWSENGTVMNGGGNLHVNAGNDIVGGEYYVGLGSGKLQAGGSIAQATSGLGVLLNLGDGSYDLQARRDLNLASVLNPTALRQIQLPPGGGSDSRFFSYSGSSAVNLAATAGNIVLQNDVAGIKRVKNLLNDSESGFEYAIYPGTLKASAYAGDIRINNAMTLFPSTQGQLELLAQNNIGADLNSAKLFSINMSDTDISLLPSILRPAVQLEGSLNDGIFRARERLDPANPFPNIVHASTPLHLNNPLRPLIIANKGDIGFSSDTEVTFFLPKAATLQAGRDILNVAVNSQNLAGDDITLIQAGRDIVFDTVMNDDGNILSNIRKFQLGGPGELQVLAGRDINLGSAEGIQTIGNLFNSSLSVTGAGINILTGLAGKIDYAGFVEKYRSVPEYSELLSSLEGLSDQELRVNQQTLLRIFFNELKESASAAAAVDESQRTVLYQRGFDAVKALFPDESYQGDLRLVFSQVKTLAGGDINLAVPGGDIDVGLAGQLAGIRKTPDQLGIVVQQLGNLSAFVNGDFSVNQSRVFTLRGGDILVWSSEGSIDAGKGAKSAISAPPPISVIDAKGNVVTIFPPIVSGSGIQAIGDGQVTLAAPFGIVDAGEAGISGGRIVIAATAVIGASNIQASGGTVGVPTTVSAPVGISGVDGAATSAAQSASQSASGDGSSQEANNADGSTTAVSMLSADVVGYGECSVGDIREGKAGCGG